MTKIINLIQKWSGIAMISALAITAIFVIVGIVELRRMRLVLVDHENKLEQLQTGVLPLYKRSSDGKILPFPQSMAAKFDTLVVDLQKIASLTPDLLFFPENVKKKDLFKNDKQN